MRRFMTISFALGVLTAIPALAAADEQPRFPDAAYITDTVRPTGYIGRAGLSKRLQTTRTFKVEWDAVDRGGHVADTDVRVRSARHDGAFGSWRTWLRHTSHISAKFRGAPGHTYCFSVRATDWVGNVGAWSRERCTATPLGASSMTPRGDRDWRAVPGSKDLGRAKVMVGVDGILTSGLLQANRVALIATKCPGCGKLQVIGIGGVDRIISLEAKTERRGQLVPVATFKGVRSGTLVLRVFGSSRVRIEGLAVTRATDSR
jgi:hypothetical protein